MKKQKLTLEEIRHILFENFDYMSELDVIDNDDNTQIQSPSSATQDELNDLSSSEQYSAINLITTVRNNRKFDLIYNKHKKNYCNYILNTLAHLYMETQESKYKNAVWVMISPVDNKGDKTPLYNQFVRKVSQAGSYADAQAIEDIVINGMYDSIDKALNHYKVGDGNFINLYYTITKNKITDIWRKEYTKMSNGEKVLNIQKSIDAPLGGGYDDDDVSLSSTLSNTGEKPFETNDFENSDISTNGDKILKLTDEFIKDILQLSDVDHKWLQIYDLYVNKGMRDEDVADTVGVAHTSVRAMKMRIQDYITEFIHKGYYQDFLEKHGIFIQVPKDFKYFFPAKKQVTRIKNKINEQIKSWIPGKNNTLVIDFFVSEEEHLLEAALTIKNMLMKMGNVYKNIDAELSLKEKMLNEDKSEIGLQDLDKKVAEFAGICINAIQSMAEPLERLEDIAFQLKDEPSIEFKSISNLVGNTVVSFEEELFGKNLYGHSKQVPGYLTLLQKMVDRVKDIVHRGTSRAEINNNLLATQKALKTPNKINNFELN